MSASPKRPRHTWQAGEGASKIFELMFGPDSPPRKVRKVADEAVFNELMAGSPISDNDDAVSSVSATPEQRQFLTNSSDAAASSVPKAPAQSQQNTFIRPCLAACFTEFFDESGKLNIRRVSEDEESKINSALEEALKRTRVKARAPQCHENFLLAFCDHLGSKDTSKLRCVPTDGKITRRLPETFLGDLRVSSVRLPSCREQSGKALTRCIQIVSQLLGEYPNGATPLFKIGITCNPLFRFTHYEQEGYTSMHLLYATESRDAVCMMEAALIKEFKGSRGCKNIAPGGEGASGRAPHFAYCVIAARWE